MVNSGDVLDGQVTGHVQFRVSSELHSRFRRSELRGGELLVTLVGANFGQVAIAPPEYAGHNVARPVGVVPVLANAEFVMFALRSPVGRHHMDTWANTTAQPTLNLKDLGNLPIPEPPADVQVSITSVLSGLDRRIALLRKTNATLEAIAQALFKSWFVDFDPVRAKSQGLPPAGMDEATAALFPDGFKESALGLLPAGWTVGVLGDVAKSVRTQLKPAELNSDIHYVGLEHIPRKSLSLVSWDSADGLESAKARFSEGDVLFGKLRPYFHKVVIAPFQGVCSTDILVCQAAQPAYHGLVVMQLFSEKLIDYADRLSNGAKMPRIGWSDLAAYPIVIPSPAIAAAYTTVIAPLLKRMKANVFQAQTLATLRDTLLPRLISGQLRLPEAEALIEEAA